MRALISRYRLGSNTSSNFKPFGGICLTYVVLALSLSRSINILFYQALSVTGNYWNITGTVFAPKTGEASIGARRCARTHVADHNDNDSDDPGSGKMQLGAVHQPEAPGKHWTF
jgi:hypothetical protein